jgi:hypothetical protein
VSDCSCRACGELFNSEAAFDRHRTGPFRQLREPPNAPDRRCLSGDEMLAKGMARNARGRWVTALNPRAFPTVTAGPS